MTAFKNGGLSYWYSDLGLPDRRPALDGDITADICIVGAGFTGLWTAYYLKQARPDLAIVMLEKTFAGFGASGRNGGNMSGRFPWSKSQYRKTAPADRVDAMEVALRDSVSEIIRVAWEHGIEADILETGNLSVATNAAQAARQPAVLEVLKRTHRPGAEEPRILSRDELDTRVQVNGAVSALYDPATARVQPARLARGLAQVVAGLGVTIYEDTPVEEVAGRIAISPKGRVTADTVVLATEGFTSKVAPYQRRLIPLNSAMLVTEPVPQEIWDRIGWDGYETISESSYAYSYCQRTREGRITVGGRGVPYRFGSGIDEDGRTQPATIAHLRGDLERLFPEVARHVEIDQAWCGVLGVPRDWCASVSYDPQAGQAWAGGYVGGGVTASNLAGRTLCDLIFGHNSDLVSYPWVNHATRKWEGEPLRWLAIHAMYRLYALADAHERRGGAKTSPVARLANWVSGKPL